MKKHNWTNEDLTLVLDSILVCYKTREWSELIKDIAQDVGTTQGSVKALYTSLTRISQGHKPNPTQGGVGHNWGQNVEDAFSQWKKERKVSDSKLKIIFG